MSQIKVSPYRASEARMNALEVTAQDFGPSQMVLVEFEHDHGSILYSDAFVVDDPEDAGYVWVLTEHRGYHCFSRDELRGLLELDVRERHRVGEPEEMDSGD